MTERKYALIIGNSDYQDRQLSPLRASGVDVYAMSKILRDQKICGFNDVQQILNQSVTVVRREIAKFFEDRGENDLLLLYFSGHGLTDKWGHLYLAVKDTEKGLPDGTAIESSFIARRMDDCKSRRMILILDCCHSDAFNRGIKGSETLITAFEGEGRGRVILASSSALQYSLEGEQINPNIETSIFTHFLIDGLQTGEADKDQDGFITIDELYNYVYKKVAEATNRNQIPQKSMRGQGPVIIARNLSPKSAHVYTQPVTIQPTQLSTPEKTKETIQIKDEKLATLKFVGTPLKGINFAPISSRASFSIFMDGRQLSNFSHATEVQVEPGEYVIYVVAEYDFFYENGRDVGQSREHRKSNEIKINCEAGTTYDLICEYSSFLFGAIPFFPASTRLKKLGEG
jgi:hypothetical protein